MFCSHCALKALCHLTPSVGYFQACCCPEMNYDMINLKVGESGSWIRFQAWKDREDEVSKGGVLSDEEAWWMCMSMLQKQKILWVGFCWQSPINGHMYQTEMLILCHLDPLWPAGQLFAEQQCAAVLQCPWTPSGLLWRGRCCWMEKEETMKVNWALTGNSRLPVWSSSPGCRRVLDQPSPLLRQLGHDC